jgi:hypothetical protein
MSTITRFGLLICCLVGPLAHADERHPAFESKFVVSLGGLSANRNFKASAEGSVMIVQPTPLVDFASDLKVDDSPELFVIEMQWQFSEKWNLGLQHFNATRSGSNTLGKTIEWADVIYEVGTEVNAVNGIDMTRIVFTRKLWQNKVHDFRVSVGLHRLEVVARISGEATLGDGSTFFTRSRASASVPIPNVGGVYRYSPSDKWLFVARADWFSASVGNYSGGIWNAATTVNYRVADHIGIGLGYQFFQIDGALTEERWSGDLKIRFNGPILQIAGFW